MEEPARSLLKYRDHDSAGLKQGPGDSFKFTKFEPSLDIEYSGMINVQQMYEKMLSITNHQGNAN